MTASQEPHPSAREAELIAGDELAARQWELYLLDESLRSGRRAWRSPAVAGYASWTRELWSRTAAAEEGLPIDAEQSRAAWRQVVDASPARAALLSGEGPAGWAAEAWRLLHRWAIPPDSLRADGTDTDFATFLGWCRDYRQLLESAGWVDAAGRERGILAEGDLAPRHVRLADGYRPAPVEQALLARLAERGGSVASIIPPQRTAAAARVRLADPDEELGAAAEWARSRLRTAPEARGALVIDGLEARASEVRRLLAEHIDPEVPVWIQAGETLGADPAVADALSALEMLSPAGGFAQLSRWLRSPFFQGLDPELVGRAAATEAKLRGDMAAQLGFLEAYRSAGLAAPLRREAPALAARIDAALREIEPGPRARTPTGWAGAWQRCLRRLGWPARDVPLDARLMRDWENALERFGHLTPMLGPLEAPAALAELRRVLRRPRPRPLPPRGLHVFSRIEQVGPGYAFAWVTGMTNRAWPRPARPNPLLPRALQAAGGMPDATPAAALEACRRETRRLLRRVGALVVSWPAYAFEEQTAPSGLIEGLPETGLEALGAFVRPRYARGIAERVVECVADPPPPLTGTRIEGGARTLDLQARCPARAFCDGRLATRALEPPPRGLPARVQGLVAHRAAELLLLELGSQRAIAAARDSGMLERSVVAAVGRALGEAFGSSRRRLEALFVLERVRFADLLREFLDHELRRAPFEVAGLERRVEVAIGAWTIAARIDRLDTLADGTTAILDYKTGQGATVQDWFRDRLRDPQLPLYAVRLGERVAALAVAALRRGATPYRGIWRGGVFPGRPAKLPGGASWAEQRQRWREQIERLAEEYAAGDARIFTADAEAAKGAYAPLTRVYEQLAREARRRA